MKRFIFLFSAVLTMLSDASTVSGKLEITNKENEAIKDFCEDVVVFLTSSEGKALPKLIGDEEVEAINRTFAPGVKPIVVGSKVNFPNKDKVLHNVFSLSKAKKFDLGLYSKGESKSVKFEKSGIVKVYCNIHPGMVADILVLENSLYSKASNKCEYRIENVPKGNYKLSAWYRYGKGVEFNIKVSENEYDKTIKIIHTKKGLKKHKNKFGKSYKKAY